MTFNPNQSMRRWVSNIFYFVPKTAGDIKVLTVTVYYIDLITERFNHVKNMSIEM